MLHERRNDIIEKIKTQRMVKVSELVQEYEVSIETVRRDLEDLEKKGYLRRVYGGAVLMGLYGEEPTYEHREIINYEQKAAIGKAAAGFINDGDTVIMDLGTTTLEVVKQLKGKANLTIITNATQIACAAVDLPGCKVILLGGVMRQGELSVSGSLTDGNLARFYANKAVIGVGGITVKTGVTDYHVTEAGTRREMIRRADKIIAVADYSKFGVTALNAICPVQDITALVTDWTTPEQTIEEYEGMGVHVCVALPDESVSS